MGYRLSPGSRNITGFALALDSHLLYLSIFAWGTIASRIEAYPGSRDSGEKGEIDHEFLLEFMITALFADHVASKEEETEELDCLSQEIDDLKSEMESLKSQEQD